MNLPKLPRDIIRPEDEPGRDKELWQPNWKCFCCHDTGTVQPYLVRMVIDGYRWESDKIPVCQNPSCIAASGISQGLEPYLDYRLDAAICQQLDLIDRDGWRETLRNANQRRLNTQALAQKMNLRQRDRSSTEEMEARQRHASAREGWGSEAQSEEERQWLVGRNAE
ncbi:hypothetical protein [Coleofasciculus sp. FACHB-129]|uniref:hypothetical protein n=1 Tax=Cyanophyceae TaxID=3028117 RepID=UPI0016852E81|nr:hypothetical protein [Coleofasciculus sp. FACHB-129]MBD1895552.1 hypothetical protein [Coleofasciculus sp. FACHB-129]